MEPWISSLKKYDICIMLLPVIKIPEEVVMGSLLFLNMIEDAKILYDDNEFFGKYLTNFASRLKKKWVIIRFEAVKNGTG
jgi:hypothetical protein